jgi:hypothetical protein
VLPRLLRQRQPVVGPRQGLFYVLPFGFDFGEQSLKEWDLVLDSGRRNCRDAPLEAPHYRFQEHRDVRAPS